LGFTEVNDFSKSERKLLRSLAGEVYEAEAGGLLADLETSFKDWRARKKLSSELLQDIHEFHQHRSRELWSMYQGIKDDDIVARGVALGLIEEKQIEAPLLAKLQPRIAIFKRKPE
jgi:hypothetical protein